MSTSETTPAQPEWHDLDDDARRPYQERAAPLLLDLFVCHRVWEEWGYRTMTEADFGSASDDADTVDVVAAEMYDIAWQERHAAAASLAAAEAEIARLRAELAEAQELAAGPYFGTCEGLDYGEFDRQLQHVLDRLCETAAAYLENDYEPEEWPSVVKGWTICVSHGVRPAAAHTDDGEPALTVESSEGHWYYDLCLDVIAGQPELTATRRAGGAV